ncbi:MAG: DUF3487 family protein, partial [Caldilineaceae bacterium]|nr:DUF3487 family protein [Caldilineaceae bacterium]
MPGSPDSQRDGMVTFLPHHLNRQPVVVLGLTADELWICAGLSATVGLVLGIALAWLTATLAMAPTVVVAAVAAPLLLRAGTSDARALDAVWARVEQAGAYRFSAHVSQTLAPQPTAVNAGRQSTTRGLYLEGRTDRAAEALHLTVWSEGGGVGGPASGVEFKVDGDRAFARQGGGAWQEA